MDNNNNKLISQLVDILIYDYKNKYEILRMKGNNEDSINKYMNEYQKIRNKDFIEDIKKLKFLYTS
jgi:hypothetical protein